MTFLCFSRCLYCGRRTPHEVCHRHGKPNALGRLDQAAVDALPTEEARQEEWSRRWERSHDRAWKRWFYREPEECDDPECRLWEPGEYAAIQAVQR